MRRTSGLAFFLAAALTAAASDPASPQARPDDSSPVPVTAQQASLDHQGMSVRPQSSSTTLKSRIGRMVTGAVVGGWLGYFASQIAVSDWEQGPGTGIGTNRGAWAAGGVIVGTVAGRLLSPGSRTPGAVPDMRSGRAVLTYDQIVKSGATNAHELIRASRPEWLVPRGANSWRETAQGSADFNQPIVVVPGDDLILVYLDNARIGGTQNLEGINLGNVARIEFIDPAQATFRWGAGHAHGVILITTRSVEHR